MGEAQPIPLTWACRVTFIFDDFPILDRQAHGHTAEDAAALGRAIAQRAAVEGVWVSAYVLVPAHRISTITLADPVQEPGPKALRKTT